MAVIGSNSIASAAGNDSLSTTVHRMMDAAAYTYTAAANQEVFKLWVYVGSSSNGDGTGIEIGVYDITSAVNGATKVCSASIASLTKSSWNSVEITPAALTEGNTYAVAWRVISATNVSLFTAYIGPNTFSASNLTGSSALAGTWTDNSSGSSRFSIYAETQTAATGPTITDVNTDEALSPGETATITGTGFGATQGAGGVKLTQEAGALESALTGITWGGDTSITGTVALGGLSYGATTSLVVTDNAAATGSIAVTFVPATGYSYVTLSGYPGTGYVIGEDASPAVVDGDQVEYESTASSGAGVTVNADGTFVLDTVDPAYFRYRVRENATDTWSDWARIVININGASSFGISDLTNWFFLR